jgi:serine/threonine protein phosphatase 1
MKTWGETEVTSCRRIFIGDVHGHYDGLMRLMEAIAPTSSDQIYFLGDLIDRGPKSAEVVRFVRDNGYTCILGNHEQLLLEALPNGQVNQQTLQGWLYSGGHATVASYQDSSKLLDDVTWLKTLPSHLDLGDIWLVHAGVHPQLPIKEQTLQEYCWIRDEFHSSSHPYFPDKLILTGHTITFTFPGVPPGSLARGQGWIDIDTGAYHPKSGWLTALDMTHQKVYQVNVFRKASRVQPLCDATTLVTPSMVAARRQLVRA